MELIRGSNTPACYILEKQRERNSSTAQHWDLYEGHRRHVMSLLQNAKMSGKGRLCILGAGNCNDIDLSLLSRWYTELHLVDWDAFSMREGIKKQQISPESVMLHSGIELTGVARYIERWKQMVPSNPEIDQVITLLSEPYDIKIGTSFDVVLSGSLLTQLIELPVALLGPLHPRTVEVALKIRAAHFRLMASLVTPGGTGLLVTELISSDTCEALDYYPKNRLPELYARLIKERNFFPGTNPHALIPALRADPLIAPRIEDVRLTDPWRWRIGPTRSFLSYGVVFKKRQRNDKSSPLTLLALHGQRTAVALGDDVVGEA